MHNSRYHKKAKCHSSLRICWCKISLYMLELNKTRKEFSHTPYQHSVSVLDGTACPPFRNLHAEMGAFLQHDWMPVGYTVWDFEGITPFYMVHSSSTATSRNRPKIPRNTGRKSVHEGREPQASADSVDGRGRLSSTRRRGADTTGPTLITPTPTLLLSTLGHLN